MTSDFISIIQWWIVLFILGLCFLPFTILLFESFLDSGYIFSKIIGTITVSYLFFILGILHIVSFNKLDIFSAFLLLLLFSICLNVFITKNKSFKKKIVHGLKTKYIFFVLEEMLFFLTLFIWSSIRAYQPDIYGLEKFMDFGFVNSILRSSSFPPKDIWFPPYPINYYYFGHLITAVLTKLSNLPSYITYNLMLASLFAFTFTLSFSIGINLVNIYILSKSQTVKKNKLKSIPLKKGYRFLIVFSGFLSASLVSLAGNIHALYSLFKPYDVVKPVFFTTLLFSPSTWPNQYWYPNATRFIYNTIHEFPIYSFVVSDLHGHVLSIPIVLCIIAVLLHEFLNKKIRFFHIIFLSFLLACAYMTNAWDGAIYFLLTTLVVGYIRWQKIKNNEFRNWIIGLFVYLFIVGLGFFIFAFPFNFFFKPPVSGIGILCAPKFLTDLKSLGPILFEENHCQKSPLWQLLILYGFFYFWVFSFFMFIFKNKRQNSSDVFVLFLIALSTLLIIIPEFIYVKDIYPAHYRANTMFKLVYESFIMLSLCCGYIIVRIITSDNIKLKIWAICIGGIGIFFVLLYPFFAVNSYYGNLLAYKGLDGIQYIKMRSPSDYHTIQWFNSTVPEQPVILEAQGDSYTDYERISANTGLPTVLGWTVHEWLWRKTYDVPAPRIAEVKTIYESDNIKATKKLLKKYDVLYVVVGDLERQKYEKLEEEKFQKLGKIVFRADKTKVYKIL